MALIQCTKKLLDELPAAADIDHKPTLLGNWHANMIRIERRKCVLFTHDETLFSLFVPKLTKPHFQNLTAVFLDNLTLSLKSEGLDQYIDRIVAEYTDNLTFTKTSSRSVLGSMNDFVNCMYFMIPRFGGIEELDPLEINRNINRIPLTKKLFHNAVRGLQQMLDGTAPKK